MIHIKGTITFDKNTDLESLETVNSCLFTYNMMSRMCGAQTIPSEQVDCGDTVELRFDTDFDTNGLNELSKMIDSVNMMDMNSMFRGI